MKQLTPGMTSTTGPSYSSNELIIIMEVMAVKSSEMIYRDYVSENNIQYLEACGNYLIECTNRVKMTSYRD